MRSPDIILAEYIKALGERPADNNGFSWAPQIWDEGLALCRKIAEAAVMAERERGIVYYLEKKSGIEWEAETSGHQDIDGVLTCVQYVKSKSPLRILGVKRWVAMDDAAIRARRDK